MIVDTAGRGLMVKKRTNRFWSDEEKRSICFQTQAPGVSIAQVARRYALNANLIHNWLRDPRFAPEAEVSEEGVVEDCFLAVELEASTPPPELSHLPTPSSVPMAALSAQRVDITLSDGRRILIEGTTGLSAVVAPVEGLLP